MAVIVVAVIAAVAEAYQGPVAACSAARETTGRRGWPGLNLAVQLGSCSRES